MTPSFDNLRRWHGVIFVRKGLYQGGVFKFIVELPQQYNDHDAWPHVVFTSQVVSPFVTPQKPESAENPQGAGGGGEGKGGEGAGGVLDLKSSYPTWDPTKHFMVTVLALVKKIFYLKDEDLAGYQYPANPEAKRLFLEDKVIGVRRRSDARARPLQTRSFFRI